MAKKNKYEREHNIIDLSFLQLAVSLNDIEYADLYQVVNIPLLFITINQFHKQLRYLLKFKLLDILISNTSIYLQLIRIYIFCSCIQCKDLHTNYVAEQYTWLILATEWP